MKPGIYRGIPNDDYHRGPGISKSGLDLIRKSPAHYRAAVTAANDNRPEPTPSQVLGTAFHMLVLEPAEFVRTYTLALRPQDVPHAIEDRDRLVAMVEQLNAKRLPKLSMSGTKDELIARISAACVEHSETGRPGCEPFDIDSVKAAELKDRLQALNAHREGIIPSSGTRHELASLLRENGVEVTLWSDVQAEWLQNNAGRVVLTESQWKQLHDMRDALMAHPAARKLLSGSGEAELSAYWEEDIVDPITGERIGSELCRVRPDYWRHDGILVDLKSTADASKEEFARSIHDWRYHVQHPFYLRGARKALAVATEEFRSKFKPPKAFAFVAVEQSACVVDGVAKGVGVYTLDADSVEVGRRQYREDLANYAKCQASGVFPGYSERGEVETISLPAWALARAGIERTA